MQDSIKQDENVVRTYAQREQIFAKEYLDVNDFMCLSVSAYRRLINL